MITQAQFARLCGVHRASVHCWIKKGRIKTDASGLIDPEAATRMLLATESQLPHHQARKAQIKALKALRADKNGVQRGVEWALFEAKRQAKKERKEMEAQQSRLHRADALVADLENRLLHGKRCESCGDNKPLSDFNLGGSIDGHSVHCRICVREKNREWFDTNRDRMKAYRQQNYDHLYECAKLRSQALVNDLDDGYIRRLLVGRSRVIKASDIPAELVEAKREQLRILRFINSQEDQQ